MSEDTDVAFCPHCGNTAPQQCVGGFTQHTGTYEGTHYTLVTCQSCKGALLYSAPIEKPTPTTIFGGFSLAGAQLVWPNAGRLHHTVPEAVRKCYEEAAAIKARAPNAFANQIRRALEALCKDRGATKRTLSDNIKELVARGEIPTTLADMTDILRLLGNIGSHADEQSVEPAYVEPIDEFFRAVIEYVYVAPHKVNEVKAELAKAKKSTGGTP